MAGSLVNTAEALALDWLFTAAVVTRPTAWYVALFTVAPTEAAGGTEVTGGAYVRMPVTFTRSGTAPTQVANNANIEWPTATANWGTIVYAAVFDAPTGGNMLPYGDVLNPITSVADPQTINTGNIFRFNAGDLVVTCD
jgi:hypothetical protein